MFQVEEHWGVFCPNLNEKAEPTLSWSIPSISFTMKKGMLLNYTNYWTRPAEYYLLKQGGSSHFPAIVRICEQSLSVFTVWENMAYFTINLPSYLNTKSDQDFPSNKLLHGKCSFYGQGAILLQKSFMKPLSCITVSWRISPWWIVASANRMMDWKTIRQYKAEGPWWVTAWGKGTSGSLLTTGSSFFWLFGTASFAQWNMVTS